MKAIIIFVLFLFMTPLVYAQDMSKSKMLRGVEVKPPVFTGVEGTADYLNAKDFGSIYDYLSDNIEYPNKSSRRLFEGTTIIQFTIFPDGEIGDFKIVNSVSDALDDEVINVLESTKGMWRPGQNNGIFVAMEKEISVTFKSEGSDHVKLARKFYNRANKKLLKNKSKKALRLVGYAIKYQPYDNALLFLRARANLNLGDLNSACKDMNRLKSLGCKYIDYYLDQHCETTNIALIQK